ncbi:MAG TPA: DHA2 family efflux MFS transporter permease subunit [Nocardioides sp.]|nr:DHA2 family efflux MFS transporter permease subunit [Nocardioides sp.]
MLTQTARQVRPWPALVVASLAAFMVFLDTQVLFVAFDDIRASFPTVSVSAMSWTLSAYTIALAAALVPAGRMADRFGRRRTFMIGLAIFTGASLLCALAPTPAALVAFRVLQALGAAALIPSALALVLTVFPPERVPVAVAIWGSIAALSAAIGPTVGALLVQQWDWRAAFLANLPVGIVALALAPRLLPESREHTRRRFPDPVGVVLLAGSLTLVALGIVQSQEWDWWSVRTVGAIVLGLILLGAFVRRTSTSEAPAIDLRLFADRSFRWANVATAVFTIGFTAMFFVSIQFTTQVWGYSIVRAGLSMIPGPVVVVVLAPRMGQLASRFGQRALLVPGGLVYAAGGVWLLARMTTQPHYAADMLPAWLLAGLGVSLVMPQLISAAVQHLPADERAVGSGINQAVRQFGATFGVALTVALLGTFGSGDALDHFQHVWWLLVLSGVISTAAALRLPRPVPEVPAEVPEAVELAA